MRATPDNIKAIIRQQGYGGVKRAIRESYWDMYKLGYNKKEMKENAYERVWNRRHEHPSNH